MDISTFRQRYPQYQDVPDETLTHQLHQKYYKDMDFDTFKDHFLAPPTQKTAHASALSPHTVTSQLRPVNDTQDSVLDTVTDFVSDRLQDSRHVGQGLIRGLNSAGEGIRQTGSALLEKIGIVNPGATERYSKAVQKRRQAFNHSAAGKSLLGKSSRLVGEMMPWFLVPGGLLTKGLTRGVKALGAATASGGVLGGGMGALQYSPMAENGDKDRSPLESLLSQKGQQAQQGALVGGGLGLLFGLPGVAASKINQAFVNRMTQNPETRAAVQQGIKHNVPVFTSDVATPFLNKTGELLEYAPVGMIKKRLAQNASAKTAAQRLTDTEKKAMMAAQFGGGTGLKRLKDLAHSSSPRAKLARQLWEDVQSAGEDWHQIIQTSGNLKLFRAKLIAEDRFHRVKTLADEAGTFTPSEKARTLQALDTSLHQAQNTPLPRKDMVNALTAIKAYVQKPQTNYSKMMEAASDVGDLIENGYKGVHAAVGKKGIGMLQRVKEAIDEDLLQFAQHRGPQLRHAQQQANRFYQRYVIPAKTNEIAKMLKTQKPDEIYQQFIRRSVREDGKGRGAAQQLYQALDDKGRAAVRYGMVSEALEAATTRIKNQQGIALSPSKFAKSLEQIAAAKGVFFQGASKREIEGFIHLMRAVQRSGQVAENPPTGHRLLAVLAGAATTGGVASAGLGVNPTLVPAVGGALWGLRKLLTTDAGRRLLQASSRVTPHSRASEKMLERIHQFLRNAMIVGEE